jgi:hypothetical protein
MSDESHESPAGALSEHERTGIALEIGRCAR